MLRERVPIRDAVGILEALGEAAQTSKNPVLLTEYVRQSIRRAIVKPTGECTGRIAGLYAGSALERAMESSVEHGELNSVAACAGRDPRHSDGMKRRKIEKTESAVVIASAGTRLFPAADGGSDLPNLTVLSHNEVPPEVKVRSRGVIE